MYFHTTILLKSCTLKHHVYTEWNIHVICFITAFYKYKIKTSRNLPAKSIPGQFSTSHFDHRKVKQENKTLLQ